MLTKIWQPELILWLINVHFAGVLSQCCQINNCIKQYKIAIFVLNTPLSNVGWLFVFHSISTLVGYLMPTSIYIYIYIYEPSSGLWWIILVMLNQLWMFKMQNTKTLGKFVLQGKIGCSINESAFVVLNYVIWLIRNIV